jgi:hypothetical protein
MDRMGEPEYVGWKEGPYLIAEMHQCWAVQRRVSQSDQSVLATRRWNCVKVGIPCALHLAATL